MKIFNNLKNSLASILIDGTNQLNLKFKKILKPMIVAKKFGTNSEWLYDSDKFIDRKAVMSDYYLDMKEDGKVLLLPIK
jgi:hypothetical protein